MTTICLKDRTKSKKASTTISTLNSEAKSSNFVKELTTTCISNILRLRKIFPEHYFEPKYYEGLTLKVLKKGNEYMYQERMQKWLQGAFDAIDKRYGNDVIDPVTLLQKVFHRAAVSKISEKLLYLKPRTKLKQLMLEIKDSDSHNVLEIYTFTFYYQNEDEMADVLFSMGDDNNSREFLTANTQTKTSRLLQMCNAVIRNCGKLPPQVTLSMRLSYHENTPEDYQPHGYKAWKPSIPVFLKTTRSIEIGVAETRHHAFKLVNKSCFSDRFFKVLEAHTRKKISKAKRELTYDKTDSTPVDKSCDSQQDSNEKENKSESQGVKCPCLSNTKSEMMLTCTECKNLSHLECFGVLPFKSTAKKIEFCCNLCHNIDKGLFCHDKVMTNLKNQVDQTKLALLRRILQFILSSQLTKIMPKKIRELISSTCSNGLIQIVLRKMMEIGIITRSNRNVCILDRNELSNQLCNYFYKGPSFQSVSDESNTKLVLKGDFSKRKQDAQDFSMCKRLKTSAENLSTTENMEKNENFVSPESQDIFS